MAHWSRIPSTWCQQSPLMELGEDLLHVVRGVIFSSVSSGVEGLNCAHNPSSDSDLAKPERFGVGSFFFIWAPCVGKGLELQVPRVFVVFSLFGTNGVKGILCARFSSAYTGKSPHNSTFIQFGASGCVLCCLRAFPNPESWLFPGC